MVLVESGYIAGWVWIYCGWIWLYCRLNLVILPVESGYITVESGYIAGWVWLYGGWNWLYGHWIWLSLVTKIVAYISLFHWSHALRLDQNIAICFHHKCDEFADGKKAVNKTAGKRRERKENTLGLICAKLAKIVIIFHLIEIISHLIENWSCLPFTKEMRLSSICLRNQVRNPLGPKLQQQRPLNSACNT